MTESEGFDVCPEPTCPLYEKAVMADHRHLPGQTGFVSPISVPRALLEDVARRLYAAGDDLYREQIEALLDASPRQSIPIPCRHDERCCTVHNTHSMPHKGCILR